MEFASNLSRVMIQKEMSSIVIQIEGTDYSYEILIEEFLDFADFVVILPVLL